MTHRPTLRVTFWLLLLAALLLMTGCAATATNKISDYEAARDEIWAMEKAIYAARGRGDLSVYLASTSDQYKGWPPGAKVPADLTMLRKMAASVQGQNQELLEMELADFTMSGDTAVIYYHTHRTRMPNGDSSNQRYAIIHVYTREEGRWRLIGALGREKPTREYR